MLEGFLSGGMRTLKESIDKEISSALKTYRVDISYDQAFQIYKSEVKAESHLHYFKTNLSSLSTLNSHLIVPMSSSFDDLL